MKAHPSSWTWEKPIPNLREGQVVFLFKKGKKMISQGVFLRLNVMILVKDLAQHKDHDSIQ